MSARGSEGSWSEGAWAGGVGSIFFFSLMGRKEEYSCERSASRPGVLEVKVARDIVWWRWRIGLSNRDPVYGLVKRQESDGLIALGLGLERT